MMIKTNIKIKRRLITKENQEFWAAVDRIISPQSAQNNKIQVGEAWTDSERDLSVSVLEK